MPHNTLYNYIDFYIAPKDRREIKFLSTKLIRTTNAEKIPLLMFGLQAPQITTMRGPYELVSHHVSVYSTMDGPSEYHYTGYFSDLEGEYQLHVYFDRNDQLVGDPVFSTKGDKTALAIEPDLSHQFVIMAQSACEVVIPPIRQVFNKKMSSLLDKYKNLDLEASQLSAVKPINHVAYIAKLDELCACLRELTTFDKKDHYHRIEQFIKRMAFAFQLQASSPNPAQQPVVLKARASAGELPSSISEEPLSLEEAAVAPVSLDDQILSLAREFATFKPQTLEAMNAGLYQFYTATNDLFLLLDDENNYTASIECMQQLHSLSNQINSKGAAQLRTIVKKNDYQLTEPLTPFFKTFGTQDVVSALESSNAARLDFLLRAVNLSINTTPITIQKQIYCSMVQYCFQHPIGREDCFAVLIRHGANLLADIDDFPIAHSILSTESHPLLRALGNDELTRSKTIGSADFYRKLIVCIQQKNLKKEHLKDITAAIQKYNAEIQALRSEAALAKISAPGQKALKNSLAAIHSDPAAHQLLEKLKEDPDFKASLKRLSAKSNELLRLTKLRTVKAGMIRSSTEILDATRDLLPFALQTISYTEMKRQVLLFYTSCSTAIDHQIELITLQHKLRSVQRTSLSRATKRDIAREQELLSALHQHEKSIEDIKRSGRSLNREPSSVDNMITQLKKLAARIVDLDLDDFQEDIDPIEQNMPTAADDGLSSLSHDASDIGAAAAATAGVSHEEDDVDTILNVHRFFTDLTNASSRRPALMAASSNERSSAMDPIVKSSPDNNF